MKDIRDTINDMTNNSMKQNILSKFKQCVLSFILNSNKAKIKEYNYYELYFINFNNISYAKEGDIY